MPELPEVEVVRRGLSRHLPGRIVTGCRSDNKPLRQSVPLASLCRALVGARVVDIRRRAKYLLVDFDNQWTLILHLGMTGKLGLFPDQSPELIHDHLCWQLDDGRELRFNDPRRFGSVLLLEPDKHDEAERIFFAGAGPEPLGPEFTSRYLKNRAAGRRIPIKQFLMDCRTVAGIGNIYANEILFAARISPHRPAGAIRSKQWQLLVDKTREILNNAIACGGSTISDFFGADGEGGYFQVHFSVYGRDAQSCPHCNHPVKVDRLGGRSTFYCPKCQR